ncbi:MAG: hypothetical protein ACI8SR_000492 [Oceanicoccus sp.]|jgi:hypothetical protein
MQDKIIFIPVFLMVLLTAIVWARMLQVRVAAMKKIRLHPEKMKSQQAKALLPEAANIPAENFINIFEVPILFYVLIGFMLITEQVSDFNVFAAFVFVFLRYMHSFIALTYNKVTQRFLVYVLGTLVLWAMWGHFAFQLFKPVL